MWKNFAHWPKLVGPLAVSLLFGSDQFLKRLCQSRLAEDIATVGRSAFRIEKLHRVRPQRQYPLVAVQHAAEFLQHGETLLGVLDRRLSHFGKGFGAVFVQRENQTVENSGCDRRQNSLHRDRRHAGGIFPWLRRTLCVQLDSRLSRRNAHTADHHGCLPGHLDDERHLAAYAEAVQFGDARRQDAGDAGIDGITTLCENPVTGFHFEVVSGAHHFVNAAHGRKHCRRSLRIKKQRRRGEENTRQKAEANH